MAVLCKLWLSLCLEAGCKSSYLTFEIQIEHNSQISASNSIPPFNFRRLEIELSSFSLKFYQLICLLSEQFDLFMSAWFIFFLKNTTPPPLLIFRSTLDGTARLFSETGWRFHTSRFSCGRSFLIKTDQKNGTSSCSLILTGFGQKFYKNI